MRRACKYLLMNNIYFVIKVVEPTDGQEERYPQVFRGGEGVCIHSGKNRGLQFRTVSISVILLFSLAISTEGIYYMFELKVVSA